jgi:hypothetical protein
MKYGHRFRVPFTARATRLAGHSTARSIRLAALWSLAAGLVSGNATERLAGALPPPAVVTSSNITITPSAANFGNVAVGTSNSQTIKIKNIGSAKVTFPSLAVSGSGFTLTDVPSSLTMAVNTSIIFNVVFTPHSASKYSGSVPLLYGGVVIASIPLSGTGVSANPSLSLSTSSISFDDVNLGTKTSTPVTLTNKGTSNVTISSVTVTGLGFLVSGIAKGTVFKPGQSATLEASFDPTTTGAATGKISIVSNAPVSPTISLSGTGVKPTVSSVSLRWQAVSNVLGYFVYRAPASGGPYTRLTPSVISSIQYVDSMVIPGQTYYYVVTSVGSGNAESPYSNQAKAPVPVAN